MTTATVPGRSVSTLRRVGFAVLAASIVAVVLAIVMLAVRIVPTLSNAILTDSHSVPMDATMTLEAGSWVVFEQTGAQRRNGPVTTTENHAVSVTPEQVTITGPAGEAVPTATIGSNQSINRNGTLYAGAVTFTAETTGPYRVVISGDADGVIVSQDLGSTFSSLGGWFMLGAWGFVGSIAGIVMVVRGRRRPATAGGGVPATVLGQPGGAPAGWYPDPRRPGQRLWWDGARWHPPHD